jgi:peptide-methionine (S)-S-oxide reductase
MKRSWFSTLAPLAIVAAVLCSSSAPVRAGGQVTLAPLREATDWLNGSAQPAGLAGKVVIVDVFTFDCFNCKNVTPNLRALRKTIPAADLAIVGIHTPETPYERERPHIVQALQTQGIIWPVALDPNNKLWNAFGVDAWPTQFVFDRHGVLRKTIVGDSQDAELDATVRGLIAERPTQTVVFAGGCFWGMEAVFDALKGVTKVVSGYAGGNKATAHYEMVSTGTTGHAESVEITYDPTKITFDELLRVYFLVAHDPTELNRQGPDDGTQYRSEIYYTTPEQRDAAKAFIAELVARKSFSHPIVTKVEALPAFYPAEAYHQHYVARNPGDMYVVFNDLPKLAKLRHDYPALVTAKR